MLHLPVDIKCRIVSSISIYTQLSVHMSRQNLDSTILPTCRVLGCRIYGAHDCPWKICQSRTFYEMQIRCQLGHCAVIGPPKVHWEPLIPIRIKNWGDFVKKCDQKSGSLGGQKRSLPIALQVQFDSPSVISDTNFDVLSRHQALEIGIIRAPDTMEQGPRMPQIFFVFQSKSIGDRKCTEGLMYILVFS